MPPAQPGSLSGGGTRVARRSGENESAFLPGKRRWGLERSLASRRPFEQRFSWLVQKQGSWGFWAVAGLLVLGLPEA